MATIDNWISAHARHTPDSPAIEFEGSRWSYSDFESEINRCVSTMQRHGLCNGERVVWLGQNHPQLLTLLFACARIGAILAPINWRLSQSEMQFVFDDARPHIMVADATLAERADALANANPATIRIDIEQSGWDDNPVLADADFDSPDAPLLLVYTSGTTGLPKGALLSQHALHVNALNSIHMHAMTRHDRILSVLPMFHVGGLNILTTPALYSGACVTVHRRFDPVQTLDALDNDNISLCVLVPATIHAVADQPGWQTTELSSLRMLTTGSSIVPIETLEVFESRSIPVVQVYGCTETCPVAAYQTVAERSHTTGSTGRAALHSRLTIVDSKGDTCPASTSGEIVVHGEHILSGYWNNPEASSQAARHGGFATGDIGYLDEQGNLHVQDRARDLIISGGENIYPAEIERVLRTVPGVIDVAVTAARDEKWGQVPSAWLQVDPTVYNEQAAWQALAESLARFKHPRDWHIVDDFPRSPLGKIQKFALGMSDS